MNRRHYIDPDEVFLDSTNLPSFDRHQLEGRVERPIPRSIFIVAFVCIALLFAGYMSRLWILQVAYGEEFKERAENNRLDHQVIFPERGIIADRNGVPMAWNVAQSASSSFSLRQYPTDPGISHLVGYVKYPGKDSSGIFYSTKYDPQSGAEKLFQERLGGITGVKITETDVRGRVVTESTVQPPQHGDLVTLSVDSRLQTAFYKMMQETAQKVNFSGGAAALMDLETGELIAHVTYPEFSAEIMTNGTSSEITRELARKDHPFLDRVSAGLYTPGSIVKPYVALGALTEHTIDPAKQILSTGSISVPNPYNKDKPSIFRDWKAHGWVDMREAIAVSSDVYFYAVGGGFADQKGLGIHNIDKYYKMFGFEEPMYMPFFAAATGTIPTPEWKERKFNGDPWRLGDTYLTAIGQYGMQITLAQEMRALSALATGGMRIEPTIVHGDTSMKQYWKQIPLSSEHYKIVQEGMRQSVTIGTAQAMNGLPVNVAGKTGTAELGVSKDFVNSWTVGFYPYEKPRYAYVVLMEHGPRANLIGASSVMRQFFDYMIKNTPEYVPKS